MSLGRSVSLAALRRSLAVDPLGGYARLCIYPVPARPSSRASSDIVLASRHCREHGRVNAIEGSMRDVHEGDEEPQQLQGQRYNVYMDHLGRGACFDALAVVLSSER